MNFLVSQKKKKFEYRNCTKKKVAFPEHDTN